MWKSPPLHPRAGQSDGPPLHVRGLQGGAGPIGEILCGCLPLSAIAMVRGEG